MSHIRFFSLGYLGLDGRSVRENNSQEIFPPIFPPLLLQDKEESVCVEGGQFKR